MNGFQDFMNRMGGRMRQLWARMSAGMRHFMEGRYGSDRLNTAILCVALFLSLLSTLIRGSWWNLALVSASYGLMIWAIFRLFSRNTYKRYRENRRFLQLCNQLKDRDNRYFSCPKCRQTVRVPRKKGKISITCPRCGNKFVKKT